MFRQRECLRMLESIKLLLKSAVAQRILANENGLKCFERQFIGTTKSFQLIYNSGFCIWLLTFSVCHHLILPPTPTLVLNSLVTCLG
jgi:hypothetical protein